MDKINLTSRMYAVLLVIALSTLATPFVNAQCRVVPRNGTLAPQLSLVEPPESDREDLPDQVDPSGGLKPDKNDSATTILGLWKNIYFSDGIANDIGFRQFNDGGTELLNDSPIPGGGNNFCVGVWKRVGMRTYELLHTFYVFDDSSKTPVGITIELSRLIVSRDGNSFRGRWTQDNYDLSGKVISGFHLQGTVTGARISTELVLFPFPFPF